MNKAYQDFWNWFTENEQRFFETIKAGSDIPEHFLNELEPRLAALKEGIFLLAGMYSKDQAELILTSDANIPIIPYIEEIVAAAPTLNNWRFTALKPAHDIGELVIEMDGYKFSEDTLFFYPRVHETYPDEIDIVIVYPQLTQANKDAIFSGVFLFIDSYLGELNFVTEIDNINIEPTSNGEELIPIEKLKSYVAWRQKEFVEKYEATVYDAEEDRFSMLEATNPETGNNAVVIVNSQLLSWDAKASHPWVAVWVAHYADSNNGGFPTQAEQDKLDEIEDELLLHLTDKEGYLNIGRQTAENKREFLFACKEFRKPSKVFYEMQKKYSAQFGIEYFVYKDKYWRSYEAFNVKQ